MKSAIIRQEQRREGSTAQPKENSGFTLVEMLVVIFLIGMLMALLVPAVNLARESSRRATCQSNLHQLGLAMSDSADRRQGLYCTGAFDWRRDGSIYDYSWVGNLVGVGQPVGKMLCPTNSAQVGETFNDLLTMQAGDFDTCVDPKGSPATTLPDGTQETNLCRYLVENSLGPGAGRSELLGKELIAKFYNTNYAASWHLVRSGVIVDPVTGNLKSDIAGCAPGLKSRGSTFGPLHRTRLDTAKTPASLVPLLGDAATVGQLNYAVGRYAAGTPTAASMTGGPLNKHTSSTPQPDAAMREGADGWWVHWHHTLQDYRGFAPVHRGGVCNILFADGSVRSYTDKDHDGHLNNGFTPSTTNDFASGEIELTSEEVFSGWDLNDY